MEVYIFVCLRPNHLWIDKSVTLPKILYPLIMILFFFLDPTAYGVPGPRINQNQVAVVTDATAVATPDPLAHCIRLGIGPASPHSIDAADPNVPQQELCTP